MLHWATYSREWPITECSQPPRSGGKRVWFQLIGLLVWNQNFQILHPPALTPRPAPIQSYILLIEINYILAWVVLIIFVYYGTDWILKKKKKRKCFSRGLPGILYFIIFYFLLALRCRRSRSSRRCLWNLKFHLGKWMTALKVRFLCQWTKHLLGQHLLLF